ncbi:Ectoine dioxygenase [bacterium HR17]|uniref:Ectoine dioxygenase n=1 Tax=Candidatus Fervidibacter japonicus TaxID=2035412 RepID=A0A2H5XAB2_9BACT|nr:Ectoine dioxygenase [bacterium HR17]
MAVRQRLTPAQREQFERDGFLVVRKVFTDDEVKGLCDTFMRLHALGLQGALDWYRPTPPTQTDDPLKIYPRIMHPHRYDETARRYMLDDRLLDILADLFGEEPMAAQSMFYFKPPGARGQALHQDNFYLKAHPGTCMAAWVAIDPADEENGGMMVVPGTHRMDIVCPEEADPNESFTTHFVPPPAGTQPILVPLEAGDVLFFNGSLIHGSPPNRSRHRFRRAFICHYVGTSCTKIARYYLPLYLRDGRTIDLPVNEWGGPCGEEFPEPKGPH